MGFFKTNKKLRAEINTQDLIIQSMKGEYDFLQDSYLNDVARDEIKIKKLEKENNKMLEYKDKYYNLLTNIKINDN